MALKQKYNPLTFKGFNFVSDSTTMIFKEAVASVSNLPSTGNSTGDARMALDTDHLYISVADEWLDQGVLDVQDLLQERLMQELS